MEIMQIAKTVDGLAPVGILPKMANRHGLITGATGTGKTVTLQALAEHFSSIGVPVFVSDIKGDFSGISQAGGGNPKVEQRLADLQIDDPAYAAYPVEFWDVFGQSGTPIRATISEMGPLLLSRLLGLNEVQTGVLSIVFRVADENGMLLLDLKDLRSMVQYVGDNASQYTTRYGNISTASVGAIQRGLLTLEDAGGNEFFGEPAMQVTDFMRTEADGRGIVNILAADKLFQQPLLYSTFMLWLLSELYENLPEVGDLEKPKLVFFFDEAHLLFKDTPRAMLDKIEQVIRLIRSKAVGIYFITQNPADVPPSVLGQLGNRVQHALRAFTPYEQRGIKAAAETFRPNPKFNMDQVIQELSVGEALVSFLDAKGAPSITERTWIIPPHSRIGIIDSLQRTAVINSSLLAPRYSQTVDRHSAYEILTAKAAEKIDITAPEPAPLEDEPANKPKPAAKSRTREGMVEATMKSAVRAIGSQLGRQIARGILGGIFGGKR